ncbi:MAG: asparaginase [Streptomycetales bacterium]
MSELPVVAEVVRSGFVEGRHRGSVVGLAADGSRMFVVGDADVPVLPRSSNKPMQLVAMVRAGLDVDGELLAIGAGSHAGEAPHRAAVRRILAGAGLEVSALRTPPAWPLDDMEREAYLRAGEEASRIAMNCSGKHAAMLATCVVRGWPTESYRDPDHPLQVLIRETIEELAGEPVASVAVDGCGAPVFPISLAGLARAFRTLVLAAPGTPEARVAAAMRAHPMYVAGSRRADTLLMNGLPGLLAKGGAEGVRAVALPDGRAVALKIEDGAERACGPVLAAALQRVGAAAVFVGDAPVLDEIGIEPVLGGGVPVGTVRPTALVTGPGEGHAGCAPQAGALAAVVQSAGAAASDSTV